MARREPRRLVMLLLQNGRASFTCQGVSRRSALKAGFLGALGLSSADLLRLQARGAAKRKHKSVILLWLDGGPSHLETYDPKPEATSAYRGPWGAIDDALRIVAQGIQEVRRDRPSLGIVLITHYQRLLDEVKPDFVHILIDGRIVKSGGMELATELEKNGYDAYRSES